jgi:adenylate kinase family enzyme
MSSIVLQLVGIRGAGKSTLGETFCQKHDNYVFLKKEAIFSQRINIWTAVEIEIQKAIENKKNIIFDRFYRSIEDIFYLENILHKYNLALNAIFNIVVPETVAHERVLLRNSSQNSDNKPIKYTEELRSLETLKNSEFNKQKDWLIDIDGNQDKDQVLEQFTEKINTMCFQTQSKIDISISVPKLMDVFPMSCDGISFEKIKYNMDSISSNKLVLSRFPGTSISGYVDSQTLGTVDFINYLITIKVDGLRCLVVYYESKMFLIPSAYTSMYEVPGKLTGLTSFTVMDAEIVKLHDGSIKIFVFDIIVINNISLANNSFHERNLYAEHLFSINTNTLFEKKLYVEINHINTLLNTKYPFDTDGIILQPQNTKYLICGADKQLMKWKPQSICSIDVRINNITKMRNNKYCADMFMATIAKVGGVTQCQEIKLRDHNLILEETEIEQFNIQNNMIVECVPCRYAHEKLWKFMRPRNDKLYPNNLSIGLHIIKMRHVSKRDLTRSLMNEYNSSPQNVN